MTTSGRMRLDSPELLPPVLIAFSTLLILAVTVLALSARISIIYQNAFYIPIVLACYFYKRKGLYFSFVLISIYFFSLVIVFPTAEIFFQGLVRVLFFLLIALLVTYLSEKISGEKSRYEGIFSSSESGILLYQKDTLRVVEANQQCTDITGYSQEDLAGRRVIDLFEDSDHLAPFFSGAERQLKHYEAQIRHKEGSQRNVLFSTGNAGPELGTVTIQDITSQKRAEEAIKTSEEKFRMLFELSGDPIMINDLDGAILEVNSAAEKRLGYHRDQLITMHIQDISTPDNPLMIGERMHALEKDGRILFETSFMTSSGKMVPTEVHATLIHYGGRPAILSVTRDISDRKRAELALQQANTKLNLLNRITRHDILNSLTALLGYLELSMEEEDDPRIREYISAEMKAAENIRKQIEFTKDYQDVGVKAPGWFSVPGMIREMSRQIHPAGIRIDIDLPEIEIFADPLIEKVFYNLMENAIRHGGTLTRIWFCSEQKDECLIISCCDDGLGVPNDKKTAIFNREYFQHSGFGLFLSREILGITGIQIRETGVPGHGARFDLVIPPGVFRVSGQ